MMQPRIPNFLLIQDSQPQVSEDNPAMIMNALVLNCAQYTLLMQRDVYLIALLSAHKHNPRKEVREIHVWNR
jgi:hypothetical protein